MADSRASASASAGSSNPFRRKSTAAPGVSSSASITIDPIFESSSDSLDLPPQQPSSSDFFRQQLQALPHTNEPPPSTTFQKLKVVKKVRVQSPPPSSPESAGAPHKYPIYGYPEEDSESSSSSDDEEPEDPFRGMAPPLGLISGANYGTQDNGPPVVSAGPPPNPFKKTLEDMEHGNDGHQLPNAPTTGKGSLDVDAFKRLLMTGQTNTSGIVPPPSLHSPSTHNPPSQADAASITDASSVSRQSIFDSTMNQETPRTSHEISEAEGEDDRLGLVQNAQAKTQQTPSTLRKKPPPPSSRHGKLIKVDLSKKENNSSLGLDGVPRPSSSSSQTIVPGSPRSISSRRRSSTPSDVNKPLPPAPARRSIDEGSESIFDREAAGKVPEPLDSELDGDVLPTPRPPTPPNAAHATTTDLSPSDPRKPPPPPRRKSHSRTESKLSIASRSSSNTVVPTFSDEPSPMRRSSQDSTRSISSSLRVSMHAPAPPPPRRPNHASRPSFTAASASALSFTAPTPTNPSPALSPAPSSDGGGEHHTFHSLVPLVASPDLLSSGQSSLTAPAVPTPATALSPTVTKTKMPPPPLPPARNASVRVSSGRPSSIRSVDAPSRRVKDGSASSSAPPPPPPPKRSRAGSGRERGVLLGGPVSEEPETSPSAGSFNGGVPEEKSADAILADLNALQAEVDALRGKYEKKPAGV